jgi:hypothetical protein
MRETIRRSGLCRPQPDGLAIAGERAEAEVVDGLRVSLRQIWPSLEDFQDEEGVAVDETGVNDCTFQIGEALRHQWRGHLGGRHRGEMELLELFDVPAGAVADFDDLGRELQGGNGGDALPGGAKGGGTNSTIMCQDSVMTLARHLRAVVSTTTGPGSISW